MHPAPRIFEDRDYVALGYKKQKYYPSASYFARASKTEEIENVLRRELDRSSLREDRENELRDYDVTLAEMFRVASIEYQSIAVNKELMSGAPCIAGTRIPVYDILIALAERGNVDDVQKAYPQLGSHQILDAIAFASYIVECPLEYGF